MKWVGVSGSWRTTCPELEVDLGREVKSVLDRGDGIVSGGALAVDYEATALSLGRFPDGSRLKVILPTTLDLYAAHYRKRAGEGVITSNQAEKLIKQLELVERVGSLVPMHYKAVDLKNYFHRNTKVVEESDELLAFQVNASAGVQDTIDKAKDKGIYVKLFTYEVEE
ncbi:hypothetical protein HY380_01855 [Candidatus Saccharibacteria bacterium]|nr:hypothetical protein [Candidatus Saccharibacteria bacterium]